MTKGEHGMISKINNTNFQPKFKGTTIIKGEGGKCLTSDILDAANKSTRYGYTNTRMNGYSLIVVDKIFDEEEREFLGTLDKKGFKYIYSTEVIDYNDYTKNELFDIVKKIAKSFGL